MKTKITLDYFAAFGEKLVLNSGKDILDMQNVGCSTWEIETESLLPESEYSFELWKEGNCVRREWMKHSLPKANCNELIVNDRWLDLPTNSPFYSNLFSEVIFRRDKSRQKSKDKGNVRFSVFYPEILRNQALAITGNSFGDWKEVKVLDDSKFPQWQLSIEAKESFEYKFVIVDKESGQILFWEEGENHKCLLSESTEKSQDKYICINNIQPKFSHTEWRGAGTAVPVFSLRSKDSFGIGEFADIKKLADWAALTGQNIIQILPINDTTMTGTWEDSYPYNANSIFALHPQFINLQAAGAKQTKEFKALQKELNGLESIDYERVNNEKRRILKEVFEEKWESLSQSKEYKSFFRSNKEWLIPYAAFSCLRDESGTADFNNWGEYSSYEPKKIEKYIKSHKKDIDFYCFLQFCLDSQMKDAIDYAHSKGIGIKGDLPIGVSRTSVDAWAFPHLFHLESQAGAPPDAFSAFGQNWGFPTYNWERMEQDNFSWWRSRMQKMNEYFDCFRIDHILGFFRIWEIPLDSVQGLLGHFNPALPFSEEELRDYGFDMHSGYYSQPLVADWVINEIFGDLADEVRTHYIKDCHLVEKVNTQRKVVALINGKDEHDTRLRNGLMELINNVLFVEDPYKKGYFHPRISAQTSLAFRTLDEHRKWQFNRLYNDFFYHRHNEFWKEKAMMKLPSLIGSTSMLTCGEDLGMIPDCVPSVMSDLRILSLEIQRMPKAVNEEFADVGHYPYLCVCATGTHDMNPLRAWWEEDREATQRYFNDVLKLDGPAPEHCEPYIAEMIVREHLKSPAMLCILPLQDYLAMDGEIRYQGAPQDERINVPAIPRYYWRYRMHLNIEELLLNDKFNDKLKHIISEAGRE